jgi:hypothetical protein
MINNVPSAPFSMSFVPPMGQTNAQLSDALKRLSAAKYGKPRTVVEKEIFTRLGAADAEKKAKADALKKAQQQRMAGVQSGPSSPSSGGSSFLDEWLAKRQQMNSGPATAGKSTPSSPGIAMQQQPPLPSTPPPAPLQQPSIPFEAKVRSESTASSEAPRIASEPTAAPSGLHLRAKDGVQSDNEVTFKIR